MITAETVSSIRTFDSGGLPVVSLYARVGPGPDGQREVRTRVPSRVPRKSILSMPVLKMVPY